MAELKRAERENKLLAKKKLEEDPCEVTFGVSVSRFEKRNR